MGQAGQMAKKGHIAGKTLSPSRLDIKGKPPPTVSDGEPPQGMDQVRAYSGVTTKVKYNADRAR